MYDTSVYVTTGAEGDIFQIYRLAYLVGLYHSTYSRVVYRAASLEPFAPLEPLEPFWNLCLKFGTFGTFRGKLTSKAWFFHPKTFYLQFLNILVGDFES